VLNIVSLLYILAELFAEFSENLYLCIVFFMVLDLRLTEEGRREMPFFLFIKRACLNGVYV